MNNFGKSGLGGVLMQNLPLVGLAGVVGVAGYSFNTCLYNVEAGHKAIKFNRLSGIGSDVYSEGTHFRVPWFEWPILFPVRTRVKNIVSLTGSRDLQMVNISIRSLYRPDVNKLPLIYQTLGLDFDDKVLPSIINEILKSTVAQFTAAQLIQERERVSEAIRAQLIVRAMEFNIILEDVSITHLTFSPEYEKAVESKQVAQQNAEKAKYVVMKALEEKKNIIIRAKGDMEAAQMIGAAIKENPGFVELRRIDRAKDVAQIVAKGGNRLLLSAEPLMLNLMEDNTREQKMHGK